MRHEQESTQVGTPNDYTYNGKELNQDFDLNLSDYGARWYDASIGRWHSVDPLAEMYGSFSPYNYVLGNPMIFIDPDGRSVESHHEDENKTDKGLDMSQRKRRETDGGQNYWSSNGMGNGKGKKLDPKGPLVVMHKRQKGENRWKIAEMYGINVKYVGRTRGTERGAGIRVLNVERLKATQKFIEKVNVDKYGGASSSPHFVKGTETLYGIFVNTTIESLLEEGLSSLDNKTRSSGAALTIASLNYIPTGAGLPSFKENIVTGKNVLVDFMSTRVFQDRAKLFSAIAFDIAHYGATNESANRNPVGELYSDYYKNLKASDLGGEGLDIHMRNMFGPF